MSFEEWFNENFDYLCTNKDSAKEAFEAGAASRQGEVDTLEQALNSALQATKNVCIERDELKKELEILQGMHNAVSLVAGDLVDERDELQRKYDAMYNAFVVSDDARKEWHRCYVGIRKNEDELQKRIDEALGALFERDKTKEYRIDNVCRILKGNQND